MNILKLVLLENELSDIDLNTFFCIKIIINPTDISIAENTRKNRDRDRTDKSSFVYARKIDQTYKVIHKNSDTIKDCNVLVKLKKKKNNIIKKSIDKKFKSFKNILK